MHPSAVPILTDLLRSVSRSFYLTLRVLPSAVRPQIGLAYLLARTTDTIADTDLIPVDARIAALHDLRARIMGTRVEPVHFQALAAAQLELPGGGTNAERLLLEKVETIVGLLVSVSPADRKLIREVLNTITSGQELDLRRFGAATPEHITALPNATELDDYTYRVAGCVGEFWTKICRAHLFRGEVMNDAELLHDGVSFGKGLQLVNILRDVSKDLRTGRCYLPADALACRGLRPADLLNPEVEERLRPLYDELLDQAEADLSAGWDYTNSLPRKAWRLRLACAWPVLFGVKTIARLRRENPLDPDLRVKISRQEVKQVMMRSILRLPFRGSWEQQFGEAQRG